MIQMMEIKKPKAKDSISVLETIGAIDNDDNVSSSDNDTLQQQIFKSKDVLNSSNVKKW
jgi:hypothetical protein